MYNKRYKKCILKVQTFTKRELKMMTHVDILKYRNNLRIRRHVIMRSSKFVKYQTAKFNIPSLEIRKLNLFSSKGLVNKSAN